MTSAALFPFQTLTDHELLKELSEETLSFNEYCNMYFDPQFPRDRFTEFAYNDEVYQNLQSSDSKYYSSDDFIQNLEDVHSNDLKIVSLNVRSIPKNLLKIQTEHAQILNMMDIFCVTETWLNSDIENLYNLPNFNRFSVHRESDKAGGVTLYCKQFLNVEPVDHLCSISNCIEKVFVKFRISDKNYLVGSIYRPPSCRVDLFTEDFEELLHTITNEYRDFHIIICGDMNINLLRQNCNFKDSYLNIIYCNGFIPQILRPTRVAKKSATLIDHILVNDSHLVNKSGIWMTDISDHFGTFACLECSNLNRTEVIKVRYRERNEANKIKFCSAMMDYPWSNLLAVEDPVECYNEFSNDLQLMFNESFPIKTRIKKSLDVHKPFINNEIKILIRKKHKLQRLFHKNPTKYGIEYRNVRNTVTNTIRRARDEYYKNKLHENTSNCRGMWKVVNNILNCNASNENSNNFTIDGCDTSDSSLIAAKLNEYFANIGGRLADAFDPCTSSDNYLRYLGEPSLDDFKFEPVSEDTMRSIVFSLKSSSSGYDEMPIEVYKEYFHLLGPLITKICNGSLLTGKFPDKLSIAKVKCLFKAGSRKLISNYRPISILPSFSKILEKIASLQLFSYLESHSMLCNEQYGFRAHRSTELACQNAIRDIYRSFDQGMYTLGVFIDLAKAFDSLDRSILLEKLKHFGIRNVELAWFISYFSARKQYVVYNNFSSSLLPVNYGVPQGSIVGPMLFLLFINDIVKSSSDMKFILFADDTTVFASGKCLTNLVALTNEALRKIKLWLERNRLTLNENKTQFVVFHRKRRAYPVVNNVYLGDSVVKRVDNVKFLGVHIDCNLTWIYHINHVTKILSKFTSIMYKLKHQINNSTLLLIYNSLVYPNLIYCLSIWGTTSKSHLNKVFLAQKKIIRLIGGLSLREHTGPVFVENKLLSFENASIYMCLLFVYKMLFFHNDLTWFSFYANPSYNTRYSTLRNLRVPYIRTSHSRQSIDYLGPVLWNSMPVEIKKVENPNTFKRLLKSHLLMRQNIA